MSSRPENISYVMDETFIRHFISISLKQLKVTIVSFFGMNQPFTLLTLVTTEPPFYYNLDLTSFTLMERMGAEKITDRLHVCLCVSLNLNCGHC